MGELPFAGRCDHRLALNFADDAEAVESSADQVGEVNVVVGLDFGIRGHGEGAAFGSYAFIVFGGGSRADSCRVRVACEGQ